MLAPGVVELCVKHSQITAFNGLGPLWPVSVLVMLVVYPVLGAAVNRAVLRPEDRRFAYLRIGLAELRQLGVLLVCATVLFALLLIAFFPLGFALNAANQNAIAHGVAVSPAVFPISMAVLALLALALTALLAARMALIAPLSLIKGRLDLFGAWRMTRRRLWRTWVVVLAVVMVSLVLWFLAAVLMSAASAATGATFDGSSAFTQSDFISAKLLQSYARLWSQLISAALVGLVAILWQAPAATIYRDLTADDLDKTTIAELFD